MKDRVFITFDNGRSLQDDEKLEFIKRNDPEEKHLIKLLFQSGSARSLSIKFLTLLFSIVLGPFMVFAGEMPPDVEKEVMMEQSAEVKEPSPEVKKETAAEQSPDRMGCRYIREVRTPDCFLHGVFGNTSPSDIDCIL